MQEPILRGLERSDVIAQHVEAKPERPPELDKCKHEAIKAWLHAFFYDSSLEAKPASDPGGMWHALHELFCKFVPVRELRFCVEATLRWICDDSAIDP